MGAKGLIISDELNNVLTPASEDILAEIDNGCDFHWSVTFIDGVLNETSELSIFKIEKMVNEREKWNVIEL